MTTRSAALFGFFTLCLGACNTDSSTGARDAGDGAAGDGASDGASGDGTSGDGEDGPRPQGESAYFPAGSWFLDDVYDVPPASDSDGTIAALREAGGWGNGDLFQIDFSIDVLTTDASAPEREFTPRLEENGFEEDEFYVPDCDLVPVPIPEGGNVEGYDDYDCAEGGDCHLIVHVPDESLLYEAWRASITDDVFVSGCVVRWNTAQAVLPGGRGLQCSSADAAGFPIAPLLFTADEVAAGEIAHAIRFILPNERPRVGFVPPATHGTDTTGPAGAPYYGVHLRLRRDYPLQELSAGAQVVARALQHYGMYHADGGNIALTAQSDRHTTAKWEELLGPHDLADLTVEDFEVIDHGAPIPLTYECER